MGSLFASACSRNRVMKTNSDSFFKSVPRLSALGPVFVATTLLFSCGHADEAVGPKKDSQIINSDIAMVLEVKGRVLYRNYGEFIFRPTRKGQALKKYSTVFTDGDGWLTLAYVGTQTAAVSVPPNSIYRLEYQLPISMLLRRGFSRSGRDLVLDKISGSVLSKESETNVSGVQDTSDFKFAKEQGRSEQQTKAVRFGLRMAFEMTRIPIVFPQNNIFVWPDPKTLKASTPIVFAGPRSEPLQAYLWQIRPESKIVWSGLISKDSNRLMLTFGMPGTYLFQAFGQSGTSRSRSVRINVGEQKDPTNLFPQGAIAGDTIVLN